MESDRLILQRAETDLDTCCASVISIVKPRAEDSSIALDMERLTSLPRLFIDERPFKQVFINVVASTIKFTPGGGSISTPRRRQTMVSKSVSPTSESA